MGSAPRVSSDGGRVVLQIADGWLGHSDPEGFRAYINL
jgi:hypothetical protein